jgi:hypothetical protein
LLADGDPDDFAERFLRERGLDWAADMVDDRRLAASLDQSASTV